MPEQLKNYLFSETEDFFFLKEGIFTIIKIDKATGKTIPGYNGTDYQKDLMYMCMDAYAKGIIEGRKIESREINKIDYYYVHLLVTLGKEMNMFKEYDSEDDMWAKGLELYNEFLESEYNDEDDSEYDCIEAFLENYQQIETWELIDNRNGRVIADIDNPKNGQLYNILLNFVYEHYESSKLQAFSELDDIEETYGLKWIKKEKV